MPWRDAYSENFGLKRQLRRRFVSCSSKLSHSFAGYSGLAAQRHVMKCDLHVLMTRLDALCLYRYGGTNWYLILFFSKPYFRLDDASLSRIKILYLRPLIVNMVRIDIAESHISEALRVLVVIAWMILVSQ